MPVLPLRILFACLCATASIAASSAAADPPALARPPQVVLISFDGNREIAQWQRSRTLAAVTGARFTYFLSCVNLISRENSALYRPPGRKAGSSNVGFADSKSDVADRLAQIWNARAEGHDIASHACGHFDGKGWSTAQWTSEFDAFRAFVRDAYAINGISGEPRGWKHFAETGISGFRAPYLSSGANLDAALVRAGYRYNASAVSRGPVEPGQGDGVVQFALPLIPEGPNGRRVIAMDYNLFVRHSGGFEREDVGAVFENRTYAAFRAAFAEQLAGQRAPLEIGLHFTLMNGGAYWRALERFARDVCLRSDVECISYADYVARQEPVDATRVGNIGG